MSKMAGFVEIIRKLGVWGWVIAYLGIIVAFAVAYYSLPESSWGGKGGIQNFVDSIYFSVVTITSLGFGDIYPDGSTWAKLFVIAESICGLLVIGLFLNYVAQKQAIRIDERNREAEAENKAKNALESLKIYSEILTPVIERYLRGVFMMVTPLQEKFKMPKDIFHHDFNFQYKDLGYLYEQTILMSSDHYVPSVNAHFKNQEILLNELRYFVTHADLDYWPELRKLIFDFNMTHNQFQMQDIIINNELREMGDGKKLSVYIAEQILRSEEPPKFESGNMFSPYVALYHYTRANVIIVKGIYGVIEEVLNDNKEGE